MTIAFPRRSGQHPHRPEMFTTWAERFPTANSALAAATKDLVDTYTKFFQGHQRTAMDESATPGARLVKSAKEARAKLLPAMERVDKAALEAEGVAVQLGVKTEAAYNPANPSYPMVMRHQEIRAHFKGMPQSDRLKALERARTTGDEDTLVAVASVQPFLSGLPPELHQHARDTLIEAHAPKEAAVIAGINEQRKFAAQLRDTMAQSVSDLVDFGKADEIIAAASADLA